jgi:hypothetical protein
MDTHSTETSERIDNVVTPESGEVVNRLTDSERKSLNRKKYRERQKKKKENEKEKDEKQKEHLVDSSPIVSEYRNKWNQMCSIVEQFNNQYGRFPNIRGTHKAEAAIGRWLYLQRQDIKRGTILPEFHSRLVSIGVSN